MAVQEPYGHLPANAYLHGTATVKYTNEKRPVSSIPADQHKNVKKKGKNQRFKTLIHCCFPCVRKTESYSLEEAPKPIPKKERVQQDKDKDTQDKDRDTQDKDRDTQDKDRDTQDKDRDTHLKHLISRSGNFQGYPVSSSEMNEEAQFENAADQEQEETSLKVQGDSMTLPRNPSLGAKYQAIECEQDDGKDVDTQMKSFETDLQNIQSSLVEDLKDTIRAVSADLNKVCDPKKYLAPRPSVRERPMPVQKLWSLQPKDLLRFRFPQVHHQQIPQIQMMTPSEVCYPEYSDFTARRTSLRNCRDVSDAGYETDELARDGWFFGRQVLITFCCGLEMPIRPKRNLQNVHREKSLQCSFAPSLRSSVPDSSRVSQGAREPQGGAQASGGEWGFNLPVQASDNDPGLLDVLATHAVFPYQESAPSNHWVADSSCLVRSPTSDASYRESLVTNETQLNSVRFEPYVEDLLPAPRTNPESTHGQLRMRGMAANPMAAAHRCPNDHAFENLDDLQFLPFHQVLANLDQLNMGGTGDVDHRPRHRQFGAPPMRLESFHQGWPVGHTHSAGSLADAGFFYAGYGDSVLCYSCGIGARHWLRTDDPWIEHARLQATCVFVKTIQGQHFIDVAREMTRRKQCPTYRQVRLEANCRQQAAEGADGAEASRGRTPPRDNDDAAVELLCKFCFRRERTHMMTPCGHVAVCEQCSWPLLSCPLCHTLVQESFPAIF